MGAAESDRCAVLVGRWVPASGLGRAAWLLLPQVLTTKGGYMARVEVNNFNVASHHHVTTSKELLASTLELAGVSVPEGQEPPVEEYYKAVFKFM